MKTTWKYLPAINNSPQYNLILLLSIMYLTYSTIFLYTILPFVSEKYDTSSSQLKNGLKLFWPGYSLSLLEAWKHDSVIQIGCWPRSSKSNGVVANCSLWTGLRRFCLSLIDISSNPDGTFIPTWPSFQRLLHWNRLHHEKVKMGSG